MTGLPQLLRWFQSPSHAAPKPRTMPLHPFCPVDLQMPEYVANTSEALELLVSLMSGLLAILGAIWLSTSRLAPRLLLSDKLTILWFALSGSLHVFFEGYFVLNHKHISGASDLFAQMWKEYAKSDSRYLTGDTFVLSVETITVLFLGPLSLCMIYLITLAHSLRYPLQAIVSVGHIYSDTLYYVTSLVDLYLNGKSHCRPEAQYFWFYFVFMNLFWIIVPGILLYQSVSRTASAFNALDRMSRTLQGGRSNADTVKLSDRKRK